MVPVAITYQMGNRNYNVGLYLYFFCITVLVYLYSSQLMLEKRFWKHTRWIDWRLDDMYYIVIKSVTGLELSHTLGI